VANRTKGKERHAGCKERGFLGLNWGVDPTNDRKGEGTARRGGGQVGGGSSVNLEEKKSTSSGGFNPRKEETGAPVGSSERETSLGS